jgi:hypothetical protein
MTQLGDETMNVSLASDKKEFLQPGGQEENPLYF